MLYDGEGNSYYDFTVRTLISGRNISADLVDFKWLFELREEVGGSAFQALLKNLNYTSGQISDTYLGTDELAIKYCVCTVEGNKYITVISTGEFQPGRYKIYLEGVWEF